MGFSFSGVTSSISRLGRQVSSGARKIGKQTSQNLTNAGAAPFEIVGRQVSKAVSGGLAPALGSVTQVARQNPELTRLAGSLTGLPLGDAFGGATAAPVGFAAPAPAKDNTMLFVIGGIAALVVIVLIMKR